jgi:CBS domain-containing protein
MTKGVESIDEDSTLAEAAKLMVQLDVGALPISDADDHLVGMLTDRDIVVKALAAGMAPAETSARELAQTEPVVVIGADQSVDEAIDLMMRHQIRRLPVVDDGELVGMLTQADISRAVANDQAGRLVEAISAPTSAPSPMPALPAGMRPH